MKEPTWIRFFITLKMFDEQNEAISIHFGRHHTNGTFVESNWSNPSIGGHRTAQKQNTKYRKKKMRNKMNIDRENDLSK